MKVAQFQVALNSAGKGIVTMSCPKCGKLTVLKFDSMTTDAKVICRCGTKFWIGDAGYQTAKRTIERYNRVMDGIAAGPKPR